VVAHTIGWIAKALIFRDYWLCWIISVLFEIMEYTFEHQLPNFGECWWDHWILDVLTSNWLGIYLGMKLCEYFELKVYSFRGFHEIKSYKGKIARGVQQFGPHSWTKFEWGTGKSLYRFVGILGILTLEIICELNAFYLKTLLWIPIESRLNVWRLVFYFFTTMPAVREAYQYLSDAKCKRLGFHAWMCTANILTELIIIIKFSKGEFPNQIPGNVIWFWISAITIIIMYATWKFKIDFIKKHQ
jgi:phosphatidylserine synthase 2